MKILFLLRHPVDTHMDKRIGLELERKGHEITYVILEKENILRKIMKYYNLQYLYIGDIVKGYLKKSINSIKIDWALYNVSKKIKPDISFSACNPYLGHISTLCNFPFIGWADTEPAKLNKFLSFLFVNTILTPNCYLDTVPKNKHITFRGYKELIYTHPNVFKPNNEILDELKLSKNDKIFIMRFSAKASTHDYKLASIEKFKSQLLSYIKKMERYGTVYISNTEKTLGSRFKKYNLNLHPAKYLDLLAFSSLYYGEGTTSACEAGCLGTPWIYPLNSFRGYLDDQQNRYGLGYIIPNFYESFEKAIELASNDKLKKIWAVKREKLLNDKIDVGKFIVWFLDKYPESISIIKENPTYQNKFQ